MKHTLEDNDLEFSREEDILELTGFQGRARICWTWTGEGKHGGPFDPEDPDAVPALRFDLLRRDSAEQEWQPPERGESALSRFHRDSPQALKRAGLIILMDLLGPDLAAGARVDGDTYRGSWIKDTDIDVIDVAAHHWPDDFPELFDWLLARSKPLALHLVAVMVDEHEDFSPEPEHLQPLLEAQHPGVRRRAMKLAQHLDISSRPAGISR